MSIMPRWLRALALTLAAAFIGLAFAQPPVPESTIRKTLAERFPEFSKIDEVGRTPMPGLFEVRVGNTLYYTDAQANFLIQGQLWDTQRKRNLTDERLDKLLALDFNTLPVADAITIVKGNGKRRLAVFQDPNCSYCKRFERDIQSLDNVTIHMFLFPILGVDSLDKSRGIWCSGDRAKTWADWMVRDVQPPRGGTCDSTALNRNRDFGRKFRITGTPTLVFGDGSRVPGAMTLAEVERKLNEIK